MIISSTYICADIFDLSNIQLTDLYCIPQDTAKDPSYVASRGAETLIVGRSSCLLSALSDRYDSEVYALDIP